VAGRPSGGRSPKRRRLSRSAEFERVYRQGRSKANRYLVLYAFPREGDDAPSDDGPRLGLSVSRRVGGAVDRTKVKRVLREAFWTEAERLPTGSDYVVVARPDSRDLAEREGMPGVRTALVELVDAMSGAKPSSASQSEVDDPSAEDAPSSASRPGVDDPSSASRPSADLDPAADVEPAADDASSQHDADSEGPDA
jgi:ribonuclease P protein component